MAFNSKILLAPIWRLHQLLFPIPGYAEALCAEGFVREGCRIVETEAFKVIHELIFSILDRLFRLYLYAKSVYFRLDPR